jgi:two-component system, chemotaxis family, chemotaxis protein CheY
MKVLTVDDSAIIRKIIRGAIEMIGFTCLEAEDGQVAMNILNGAEGSEVGLVILDWNMPVKDGYETLCEIKKSGQHGHLPVMMVTTEAERTSIIKAIQAGAKQYLTKPFSQEDLITKMMEAIA